MARNYEKNLTELNRLWLQKKEITQKKKNPDRPPLYKLKTVAEIRKWLPHLKNEMFYCLRQTSGIRNYTQVKQKEFEARLAELQKEHEEWLRKIKELERNENKSDEDDEENESSDEEEVKFDPLKEIATPILDDEQLDSSQSKHKEYLSSIASKRRKILNSFDVYTSERNSFSEKYATSKVEEDDIQSTTKSNEKENVTQEIGKNSLQSLLSIYDSEEED